MDVPVRLPAVAGSDDFLCLQPSPLVIDIDMKFRPQSLVPGMLSVGIKKASLLFNTPWRFFGVWFWFSRGFVFDVHVHVHVHFVHIYMMYVVLVVILLFCRTRRNTQHTLIIYCVLFISPHFCIWLKCYLPLLSLWLASLLPSWPLCSGFPNFSR